MDVKIMAFEISLGKGISMAALHDHIVSTSDQADGERLLYVDQDSGWWRGLVLTSKNIKAFSRLIRDKGIVRLSPEAIHNGELAHFNFFLINEQSKRGYFQYYHGSASVHALCTILRKKYNDLRSVMLDKACKEAGTTIINMPKHIKRRFSGYLKYEIVLRKKSFKELMEEMDYIKNITVQFKEYIPNQPLFRPLAEKAKSIRHRLTFGMHGNHPILENIIALSQGDMLKDLRGVGMDGDGFERPFRLLNEPETLERFDFNNTVLETEFDSGNVRQSMNNAPIIKRLHEIATSDGWAVSQIIP